MSVAREDGSGEPEPGESARRVADDHVAARLSLGAVQRWLGHHSPAFTLSVYVHLLDDDLGGPLSTPKPACQQVSAQATDTTRIGAHSDLANVA